MRFRDLFFLVLCLSIPGYGQEQPEPVPSPAVPAPAAATDDPLVSFQAVNATIDTILQEYEWLTGKVLIRDSNLAANALPISISVPAPVHRSELIRLIEASLLLNNYALVPGSEPNTAKVININTGKNPRSEGVHLYSTPESLPEGEQIISYYMAFQYVSANEALTVFQTHILPRAYTSFVPINSAQALLITESTNVIHQLISLKNLIDVPPVKTISEFIPLIRADAERVADTMNKLLQAQERNSEASNQQAAAQGNQRIVNSSGETSPLAGQAQVIPDTRTNRILLVCRPAQLDYLRGLIVDFDKEVIAARPLEYRLRYISAGDVLPVLSGVLAESQKDADTTQNLNNNQQNQANGQNRTVNLGTFPSSNNTSNSLNSSTGSTSSSGSSGYGSNTADSLLQEPNQVPGPQAVIVGKSRIIADSKDNKVLVIGPPETIERVRLVLDKLDRRPQQVYLATVIGQVQLNDDMDFGIDFTQTFKKLGGGNGLASGNLNSPATLNPQYGSGSIIDPRNILGTNNFPVNLGGLTLYGSINDAVRVFVRALDQRTRFKVLARPSIYTANNKLAVIASGQQIPYPGSSLTNVTTTNTSNNNTAAVASTVEFANVELRLEVIPLINSNNEVTLKIAQINDSEGGTVTISGNPVPQINSQRLTTTVTVPSGSTVVLGGLIQDNNNTTDSGIPYIDRIPYIGYLFKYHTHIHNRSELLVFIQPVVVNNDVETLRASIKEERRTKVGGETAPLAHPTDYVSPTPPPPRKPRKGNAKDQ